MRREHAWPPSDAIRRVVRPGDHAWAWDAMVVGECVGDDLFAEDLEAAIGFAGDFFDGWIIKGDLWTVFVENRIGASRGVDRDGGDEDVEIGVVFEQIAGGLRDTRGVAAHVDDRVEVFARVEEFFDSIEAVPDPWISIADESADSGWESWIFFRSMEQGDGMVGLDSEFGKGAARELGAAEDEDVHERGIWRASENVAFSGALAVV